ncbi:glycerophosphoryl diester phosphodiesterase [Shewanella sediminis HAW-EB3]|uniref:Glycerophosphoryl diester phosphodiesterase n=1 Tax=Shewanella sediminis (strain HAW-EB3) TaxID=425104 RepID=A8FRC3_SHESH|nr:glycerophosphodiester phosphodiesterase family protein [Shewanella sediminis]ABV35396.1 glycerophosphoryl diester phosphodiesterase [Shewanella sediminis HAW-EB3]
MIIFAHRGASGYAPENTLAAMKKAIELGARAVEIDIHSVEGELYVYHDRRLDHKSSGTGLISDVSREYLKTLFVDSEPIPTLWEVMTYLSKQNCLVNIELKGMTCLSPFIALYPKLIKELGFRADQLLISSFHHGFLQEFRRSYPLACIAPLLEGVLLNTTDIATQLDAYSIHLSLSFITSELVDDAHSKGLKVFVYTVDHPEDIHQLNKMGVDGIFTNYPDKATQTLAQA